MEISSIGSSTATMAVAVKQLQVITEIQLAVMQQLAESQQEMTAIMQAAGIGRQLDIYA
jgi:hypothetical protein